MVRVLHFADAHIDMANYGRQDPETGLPFRVLDFLNALDQIIDGAINEKVDLVVFAGDAYKDRSPAPTFQREWGRRIMRLSRAGIPTLLLVGNHDISPALSRAHALDTFQTLEVPNVRVLDRPTFLGPQDLGGLPIQVIALPWISRSGMMAYLDLRATGNDEIYRALEERLTLIVNQYLDQADPTLPILLTAHASVQGAKFGGERTVMLGADLVLPGSLVRDPRLDYVALGHIHKPQNLNEDGYPPVIYPGSIERVDFGEAREDKFFIVADVKKGGTVFEWRKLKGIRPFHDRHVQIDSEQGVMEKLRSALPAPDAMEGAVVRLTIYYPRDWESLIDDTTLRSQAAGAFEFHLVKRPEMDTRIRLPEDQAIGSLSPLELLDLYWRANHLEPGETEPMQQLAAEIIRKAEQGSTEPE